MNVSHEPTAAIIAARWDTLLEGCLESVKRQFAEVLVAEGLDPQDSSSLAELTPQLLDTLGLNDCVARERVLTLVGGTCEGSAENRSPHEPTLQSKGEKQLQPATSDKKDDLLCVGPFQRRVFTRSEWRGPEAQEVVPGVFLGGFKAAMNTLEQRKLGITHIVNATSHQLDAPGAKVLGLPLRDNDGDQDIARHFWPVIAFIDEARAAGGAVLVHCVRGVSRSSTLVCAYIMARSGLGWQEALSLVQQARSVAKPRPGFIQQLKVFEQSPGRGNETNSK